MSGDDWKELREDLEARAFNNPRMAGPLRTLDRIEASASAMREALEDLLSAPWVVDEATVPKMGADSAPEQVVGTLSVGLVRLRRARATLATDAGAAKLDELENAHASCRIERARAEKAEAERDALRAEASQLKAEVERLRETRDHLDRQAGHLRAEVEQLEGLFRVSEDHPPTCTLGGHPACPEKVAQARREERERCALRLEQSDRNSSPPGMLGTSYARLIRALGDE